MSETTTTPTAARPRINRKRLSILLMLLALALLLASREILDRAWADPKVAAEVARLERRHGPLTLASMRPVPVPPLENRARFLEAAASLAVMDEGIMSRAAGRGLTGSEASEGRLAFPLASQVRESVEANREAVRLALLAAQRKQVAWEINYALNDLPPLLGLRTLSNALRLTSALELEAGRDDEAARVVNAGLAEAAALRQSPMLVHLMGVAIASTQVAALRDILERGEPGATVLAETAALLDENGNSLDEALLGEMKWMRAQYLRAERGEIPPPFVRGSGSCWTTLLGWVLQPWTRSAHAQGLQALDRLVDLQRTPPYRRPKVTAPGDGGTDWLVGLQLRGLERVIAVGDEHATELVGAKTAVALRRHRIDRGAYPAVLSDLAPRYLRGVPVDPNTGRPPTYARRDKGFDLDVTVSTTRTKSSHVGAWRVPK